MIIPAAAGGAVDTIARLLGDKLTVSLGQPVVPENRPGAATMIASDMTAKAPPDGYTFLVMTVSHTINAAVRKRLRYDPINDFVPVSLLATLPDVLVVNPGVQVRSVKGLVELARTHPGAITFGSAGTGSGTHLEGELFKSIAKVNLLHVPYKTGVLAVTDTVAGHVQVLFFNAIGVTEQIKAGKLRPLAVTGPRRSALFPDLPTMSEAGVTGYQADSWYGVLLPAGTPQPIVTRLNAEIVKALRTADVGQAMRASGAEIVGSTPEQFATHLREDIGRWQKLVEQKPELKIDE